MNICLPFLFSLKSKMKVKKRRSICRKPTLGKRIKVIFKGLDWTLFLGFCFLAGHFMNNVIDEYQAKKTSFTQSLEPIKKLPTIVICLKSKWWWLYEKEIIISYQTPHNSSNMKENHKHDLKYENEIV